MAEAKVKELEGELEKTKDELSKLDAAKSVVESELAKTVKALDGAKASTKTVFVSKDRKLEKFAGRPQTEKDLTVEEWLEDAEYHMKMMGEDEKLQFLLDHLTGKAKDEIRIRDVGSKNTAGKIIKLLRELFEDSDTVAQIQQCFYQRDQRPNESLQEYSLQLLKLANRLKKKAPSAIGNLDVLLKDRFIEGILDKQLRREMRRFSMEHSEAPFHTFRQKVLSWAEDSRNQSQSNVHVSSHKQDTVHLESLSSTENGIMQMLKQQQELIQKQQKQLDELSAALKTSAQVSNSGYRGGNRGGARGRGSWGRGRGNRYPQSNLCFNCQGEGHYARDCPNKATEASGTEKPLNSQLPL